MNVKNNRHHFLILLLLSLLYSGSARTQVLEEMKVGDTCSYFGEALPEKVTTFSSDKEAEDVIRRIVDASGLVQNFIVRAAGVPNAAAVIQKSTRFILYNQYFMQTTNKSTGSSWGPISIMAHEVGHHLNGHTLDNQGSRPKTELEADYYSGFILQRMGATLENARVAMNRLGSSSGSSTHPAKNDRLASITSGWTRACESDPRCTETNSEPEATREPPPSQRTTREAKEPERSNPDGCEYAKDGECDEPDLCPRGTDTSDCKPRTRRSERDTAPSTPQSKLYCCDQWGRKWCQIAINPGPPGTPCWCAGVPGSGLICH